MILWQLQSAYAKCANMYEKSEKIQSFGNWSMRMTESHDTLDPNPALDGSDHDADEVEPLLFL
jgi:hypothetical protein